MLFNSIQYAIFFPLVVLAYFLLPFRFRWILLLLASYIFYMFWKAEYAILLVICTLVNYYAALGMAKSQEKRRKRLFLYLSLLVSLGMLFAFKYFNFVNENLSQLFGRFSIPYQVPSFKLLLPIGISFYTFQSLSYTIDVYRGSVKPERHIGYFALYVSFFPQLLAGPIERPGNMLPQYHERHNFNYYDFTNGLKLMAWGFFKKLVIADRMAVFIDTVYKTPGDYHGFQVLIVAIFFMIQLYADFSGYSDIAIGSAQVMGFRLMQNFNRPHISDSISEFWKRWHISLSSWIRDYVFMPLSDAFRRWKIWGFALAGFLSFLIFGIWHGAGWNFVAFGFLFGLYYAFELLTWRQRKRLWRNVPPKILKPVSVVFVFMLIAMSSVFFRAYSFTDALTLFRNLPEFELNQLKLTSIGDDPVNLALSYIFMVIMVILQMGQGKHATVVEYISGKHFFIRWSFYILLVYIILNFGIFSNREFYYFQF
jgi:alginate O-acetyltransferase complex protein AlgI